MKSELAKNHSVISLYSQHHRIRETVVVDMWRAEVLS